MMGDYSSALEVFLRLCAIWIHIDTDIDILPCNWCNVEKIRWLNSSRSDCWYCIRAVNGPLRLVGKSGNRWNEELFFDGRGEPALVVEIGSEVYVTSKTPGKPTGQFVTAAVRLSRSGGGGRWRGVSSLTSPDGSSAWAARSVLGCRLILHQRLLRRGVHTAIYPRCSRLGSWDVCPPAWRLPRRAFNISAIGETMRDANYAKPTRSLARAVDVGDDVTNRAWIMNVRRLDRDSWNVHVSEMENLKKTWCWMHVSRSQSVHSSVSIVGECIESSLWRRSLRILRSQNP